MLTEHHSEVVFFTERAWLPVSEDSVDAVLTEVLSTAAGQVWLSSDKQTEGTLKLLQFGRRIQKLVIISPSVRGSHFSKACIYLCAG